MFFAAYRGELLGSECLVRSLRGDLGVRHGGLKKPVSRATELKMHRNCTECPIPPEGLSQLVKASNYHGFGCLGVKDRGGDRPGALIEWKTRASEDRTLTRFWFRHSSR